MQVATLLCINLHITLLTILCIPLYAVWVGPSHLLLTTAKNQVKVPGVGYHKYCKEYLQ